RAARFGRAGRGGGTAARLAVGLLAAVLLGSGCTGGGGVSNTSPHPRFATGGTLRVGELSYGGYSDPQVDISPAGLELGRCCLLRTLVSYNGRPTDQGGATPSPRSRSRA